MIDNIKIQRALVSVSDKSNVIPLVQALHAIGCEIISTGGTAKAIQEQNIPVTEITKVTGNPEAFGGRMKTISFQVESAILFNREKDADEAKHLNIAPIDLVVCNLYPFEKYLNQNADIDTLIENIDIGGPTMIRSAAKNYCYVTVLTDPDDYHAVIEELQASNGSISFATRKRLMAVAFNRTADYDAMIAQAMDKYNEKESLRLSFSQGKHLRYGENSHQPATLYRETSSKTSLYDIQVENGIEISFNNMLDINAAIEAAMGLSQQGCAVIKHNNPCGLAQGESQKKALELAWNGDNVSAFGGIVAFNCEVLFETVQFFDYDAVDKQKRKFIEVIAAPSYEPKVMEYLKQQKNLRIITFNPEFLKTDKDLRYINGALLKQSKDDVLFNKLEIVTQATIDIEAKKNLLAFGLHAVRQVKSNAIVIARETEGYLQLLGIGAGQPNRVNSTNLALKRALANVEAEGQKELGDVILFSDAFFPFPDNVEIANEYNIKTIVQPGGSIRDKSVIEKCNECNICMILTGARHFKH